MATGKVVRIAYLGPIGTFTEKAAKAMNANVSMPEWIEKGKIEDVIEAIAQGEVDRGVTPLRTDYGDVYDTLDKLHEAATLAEAGKGMLVHITGYGEMPIVFYLAGKPGTQLEDVSVVATKKQAIDACSKELKTLLPNGYAPEYLDSTALGAAKVASTNGESIATLCSLDAMNEKGLVSLISAPIVKTTRFIRMGSRPYTGKQQDETALMIRIYQDRPGQLADIAQQIHPRNMTDIHLMKNKPDSCGVAQAVFVIRINANWHAAELIVDCLNTMSRKEVLYGIPEGSVPKVDRLGTYPIIKL